MVTRNLRIIGHATTRHGRRTRTATENLLITQVETTAGRKNIEVIGAVDGIDVLWIAHFDLTNSLGIPGQFEHPRFHEALSQVI